MLRVFSKLFDTNDREIKKLLPIVEQINLLEPKIKKLKDKDFPRKTQEFKERVADGESIFLLLPEAFALVREASWRINQQRPFDVQLMAGIVLAQGKVAEQKTGEGKTLSAVAALFLHALNGKSAHLVTVNDYLARRDAGWMGAIFNFLGMSVSSIISEQSFVYDPEFTDETAKDYRLLHLRPTNRIDAYKQDVVYGINSEFGFDYLRDNMVGSAQDLRQRGYYYAIIDEVDSILIDEARTPHIISAPDETPSQKYSEYSRIVDKLSSSTDYKIDEKLRTAHLTDHGIAKIEKLYGIKDIYEKDFDTVYHIEAALKANTLFQKDRDYIVRDNKVILVDEFTGRLLEGRRLSEGLHQAIEAKEGVSIQQESKTLATISLQNYFRMYERLAGMTGTAATEAEEFHKIYKLDVVVIPTHNPMIRLDAADVIYKTTRAKVSAVVREIEQAYKKGQPVLVGTTSIDKNEIISELLKRKGVKHEVLNAKNHEREALIIKDAGKRGAVTVATNMAGRGVDIILGGEPPSHFELEYQDANGRGRYEKEIKEWQRQHEEVIKLGGLLLIGTEKHESRRIDNQLRGRSGRQGDPGKSVFIVSLEDDLMRIFGGEQIARLMTRFNFPEDQPLSHGLVSKVIEQAQVKVEGFHFEGRKHTLEYDDVLNKQREIIYKIRRDIVDPDHIGVENREDISSFVLNKVESVIQKIVDTHFNLSLNGEGYTNIIDEFSNIVLFDEKSKEQLYKQIEQYSTREDVVNFLFGIAEQISKKREEQIGKEVIDSVLKIVALQAIDSLWMDHLTAIEDLRTGVGLRGYAQRDPLIEYKNEAFDMFERLILAIADRIANVALKINVQAVPQQAPREHRHVFLNQPEAEVGERPIRQGFSVDSNSTTPSQSSSNSNISSKKLGRNDPCPCGSGKKWKKCHYPNIP